MVERLAGNEKLLGAAFNSVVLAVANTIVATALGSSAQERSDNPVRQSVPCWNLNLQGGCASLSGALQSRHGSAHN